MIITKPKNFDLDQIYASGQCFRWEKLEEGYEPSIVGERYALLTRELAEAKLKELRGVENE